MSRSRTARNLSLSLLLAAGALCTPAYAQINISMAPPAPQYEAVPVIPAGHVWAPGYWAWTGERHVWVRGRTIVQREGYRWEPDRWDHRDSKYFRTAGHWERDEHHKPIKVKKGKDRHHDHDNHYKGDKGKHLGQDKHRD